MTNRSCPVSSERVNENAVRLVALLVLLLSLAFIATSFIWIFILLSFDFFIRGFTTYQLSPLKQLVKSITLLVPIKNKPVNAEPKKFAAKLGFILSAIITVIYFTGLVNLSVYLSFLLVVFASLESFAGVCVGCYIYDYTNRYFPGLL